MHRALNFTFNYAGVSGDEKAGEELPKMDARIAEGLVRKWQNIKSQAFGPDHCLERLPEVTQFPCFLC